MWDFFQILWPSQIISTLMKRSLVFVSLHPLVTKNQIWITNFFIYFFKRFTRRWFWYSQTALNFILFYSFRCCWFWWFAPKCFKRTIATAQTFESYQKETGQENFGHDQENWWETVPCFLERVLYQHQVGSYWGCWKQIKIGQINQILFICR